MGGNSNTTASNAIDDVMFSFFFFFPAMPSSVRDLRSKPETE